MRPRPLVIEFLGLPAAGKSAVMAELQTGRSWGTDLRLVARSQRADVPGMARPTGPDPTLALSGLLGGARRPLAAAHAAWVAACASDPARDRLRRWLLLLDYLSRLRRLRLTSGNPPQPRVWVFEEGALQQMLTLGLPTGKRRAPLAPLVARAVPGVIDAVVHLQVPVSTAQARLASRQHRRSRFDTWTTDDAERQLGMAATLLGEALGGVRRAGLDCLQVDVEQPVAASADAVATWLATLLPALPAADASGPMPPSGGTGSLAS